VLFKLRPSPPKKNSPAATAEGHVRQRKQRTWPRPAEPPALPLLPRGYHLTISCPVPASRSVCAEAAWALVSHHTASTYSPVTLSSFWKLFGSKALRHTHTHTHTHTQAKAAESSLQQVESQPLDTKVAHPVHSPGTRHFRGKCETPRAMVCRNILMAHSVSLQPLRVPATDMMQRKNNMIKHIKRCIQWVDLHSILWAYLIL